MPDQTQPAPAADSAPSHPNRPRRSRPRRNTRAGFPAVVAGFFFSVWAPPPGPRAGAGGAPGRGGLAPRRVGVVFLSGGGVFARGASPANLGLPAPAVYVLAGLTVFT